MSKVGNQPITLPAGVTVTLTSERVQVAGTHGQLTVALPRVITVTQDGDVVTIKRADESAHTKALHGLSRTLINNAVIGVGKPWEKDLEVVGTGYRVKQVGENLVFEVGYSHNVEFKKVDDTKFLVEGNNKVKVVGIDKQKVGEVAYKIKALKKPDPYKGKGIRYAGEVIRLKAGKKAKTA